MRRQLLGMVLALVVLPGCVGPAFLNEPRATSTTLLDCAQPCARTIDRGVRWEPSVAVDPTNARHIVASSEDLTRARTDVDGAWPLAHVSFDGGETWKTARLPGGPTAPPMHPLFKYNALEDSVITFLPDGTLLWSVDAYTFTPQAPGNTGATLAVLRSTDGGLSFPDVTIVQEGGGWNVPTGLTGTLEFAVDFQDKQWFAVAPDGGVLMVWSRNFGGSSSCSSPSPTDECTQLVFSTSSDAGRSWSRPGLILENGLFSGAFPLIREDGAWVVSYRNTRSHEVAVAISTDRGASWKSSAIDHTTKFPVLAKTHGPEGERIFMAYPASDSPTPDGPQVVTLRWSDDGGVTWSAALALDAPERDGRAIPALAATANGGAIVTYWHSLENGAQLRAVAWSAGKLSAPIVLDTTDGRTSNVGDCMGVASLPGGAAFAVWDAKHGQETLLAGARLSMS